MGAVPSSSSKSAPKLTSSLQFRRYLLTGPHGAVQCATKDSGKAQLEGEFKAMSELFKTMPTLVPRPFA
jgi:hypothetical protein